MENKLTGVQISDGTCDVCGRVVMFESGSVVSSCRHVIKLNDAPAESAKSDAELLETMRRETIPWGTTENMRKILAVVRAKDPYSEAEPPTEKEVEYASVSYCLFEGDGMDSMHSALNYFCKGRASRIKDLEAEVSRLKIFEEAEHTRAEAWKSIERTAEAKMDEMRIERDALRVEVERMKSYAEVDSAKLADLRKRPTLDAVREAVHNVLRSRFAMHNHADRDQYADDVISRLAPKPTPEELVTVKRFEGSWWVRGGEIVKVFDSKKVAEAYREYLIAELQEAAQSAESKVQG